MPGLMDFFSNLLGGQQQAPQQQGLTNPALYNQAPPEFKLPFAYKLGMLGSSINQSYGGRGGMDVGGLAKAYLENQKAQYDWQYEQSERKRKLDLVRKYAEKSGNSELMSLFEADPDAAIKYVFGVEAEKAKPQTPSVTEVNGVLVDNRTGQPIYEAPKPDYGSLFGAEGGGTPAVPAGPATVPSAGAVRTGTGDTAVNAPPVAQTVPAVVPPPPDAAPDTPPVVAAPAYDLSKASPETQASVQVLEQNLKNVNATAMEQRRRVQIMANQGLLKPHEIATQLQTIDQQKEAAVNAVNDDIQTTLEKDRTAQLEAKKASRISTSPGEIVWEPDMATGRMKQVVAGPEKDPASIQEAVWLSNPAVPQEQKDAFFKAREAGVQKPLDFASQEGIKKGTDRLLKYSEDGVTATGLSQDMNILKTLAENPDTAQGITKNPKAALGYLFPNIMGGTAATWSSLTSSLAPRMRVVGSGSSSDADVSLVINSMPSLLNTPEGNKAVIDVMLARYQIEMDRAAVAEEYFSGPMTTERLQEAFKKTQAINKRKIVPQSVLDMIAKEKAEAPEAVITNEDETAIERIKRKYQK